MIPATVYPVPVIVMISNCKCPDWASTGNDQAVENRSLSNTNYPLFRIMLQLGQMTDQSSRHAGFGNMTCWAPGSVAGAIPWNSPFCHCPTHQFSL
jgi:hypothetical protein